MATASTTFASSDSAPCEWVRQELQALSRVSASATLAREGILALTCRQRIGAAWVRVRNGYPDTLATPRHADVKRRQRGLNDVNIPAPHTRSLAFGSG